MFCKSLISALFLCLACNPERKPQKTKKTTSPQQTPLSQLFDPVTQPFAFVLPHMPVPKTIPGIRASDCGKCHESIYQEWQQSAHAHALSDLQYQAELAKPDSPRWLCLNCHTPLQDQRAKITVGLEDNQVLKPVLKVNPTFDPELQKEAVTCAVCHVRVDENGESYILGIHGSENAPHVVRKDPERLRAACLRCHDPVGEPITSNLLCWFTTRSELAEARTQPQHCSSCHMPSMYRLLVDSQPDLPIRKAHRHTFPGSGIPKTYAGYDKLLRSGWKSGLDITANRDASGVKVILHNDKAGHAVPTGDPERFLQVRLRAYDDEDQQIWEGKARIGQIWEWNPARKLGDNRIKAGEKRELSFEPPAAASLTLDILHVRLSRETAEHMTKTQGLDESLLPRANQKIRELARLYPSASYIHRSTWTGAAEGKGTIATPQELVEHSKNERLIPLSARGY